MRDDGRRGYRFGFYAYSLYVLEHYWRYLQQEAKCVWVVTNPWLLQELKDRGVHDVVFRDSPLAPVFPSILRKASRVLYRKLFNSKYDSRKRLLHDVEPDFWLTDVTLPLLKCEVAAPKILVFHSVTVKQYCFLPQNLAYDLILLPGNYHHQEMLKRFPEAKMKNFKVVGWPPHDDLVMGRFDREEVLLALGLEPDKRTVLYAPSWNTYSNGRLFPSCFPEDSLVLAQLGESMARNGYNLIVKIHPASTGIIRNTKLRSIAEEYGIYWTPQLVKRLIEDPGMYLAATDVLISDTSGIIMNYLVLDRPMIFLDPDDPTIWKDSDIPRNWRPGPVASDLAGLLDLIEGALAMPEEYSSERRTLANKVFLACDGKSGQRAAQAVLDFADQQMGASWG